MRNDPNVNFSRASGLSFLLTSLLGNNCLRGGRICIGPQLLRWRVPVVESETKSAGYAQAPHEFSGVGPQEDHDYGRELLHVGPQHVSLLGVANSSASDLSTPSPQMNSSANYHRPAISPAHQLPAPSDHARLHQRLLDANEHARPYHELSWQEPRQDFAVGTPQSAQSINQARLPLQTSSEPSYPTPQAIARLALSRLTPEAGSAHRKAKCLQVALISLSIESLCSSENVAIKLAGVSITVQTPATAYHPRSVHVSSAIYLKLINMSSLRRKRHQCYR